MKHLMDFLAGDCVTTSRTLSESFERSLSLVERLRLRMHLLGCLFCRRYRRQLQVLHRLAGFVDASVRSDGEQAASLSPDARERIRNALAPESDSRADS